MGYLINYFLKNNLFLKKIVYNNIIINYEFL